MANGPKVVEIHPDTTRGAGLSRTIAASSGLDKTPGGVSGEFVQDFKSLKDHGWGPESPVKLIFPRNVDELQHFIQFTGIQYTRGSRKDKGTRHSLGVVTMPIPKTLNVGFGATWSTSTELGAIGNVIASKSENLKGLFGVGGEFSLDQVKQVKTDISDAGLTDAIVGNIKHNVAAALNITGAKVGESVSVGLGETQNPHLACMFEGVNFRAHSFSYQFVAKNSEESAELQRIVDFFSVCMHPDLWTKGHVFDYPYEFLIAFDKDTKNRLYTFMPSILTKMDVSYNGVPGIPIFFEQTGAPVSVDINLGFTETSILTRSTMLNDMTYGPVSSRTPGLEWWEWHDKLRGWLKG
jgi:hypothetical protein